MPTHRGPIPRAPAHHSRSLTPDEIEIIERLVKSGNLIAIPSAKNAKPRRVEAAALHDKGRAVLLYLSRDTTSID